MEELKELKGIEEIEKFVEEEKPITNTAILRLKEQSPEDSVLKDMSNSEVLYMISRTTGASNAASAMLHDKKKSQSRSLQHFALVLMSILAFAAIVAAILLLGWFLHDETSDVTLEDTQLYGTWYTESGAVYTFNEDFTMSRAASVTAISEPGTYELNNSHTLIFYIEDKSYSYQINFDDDGTMSWTHYYNGIPEVYYLTNEPSR